MAMTIPARSFLLTTAMLTIAAPVAGQEHNHQQAHVHGEAQLQVAIEGATAELILRSPAANLVGFEHKPRDAAQEKTLEETRQWLRTTPLIQTGNHDCTVVASSVDHAREKADDHDHDHDHSGGGDNHSEFEVTQRLECDSALADSAETPLMQRFPDIETLSVEWVGTDGQGHTALTDGESRFDLER